MFCFSILDFNFENFKIGTFFPKKYLKPFSGKNSGIVFIWYRNFSPKKSEIFSRKKLKNFSQKKDRKLFSIKNHELFFRKSPKLYLSEIETFIPKKYRNFFPEKIRKFFPELLRKKIGIFFYRKNFGMVFIWNRTFFCKIIGNFFPKNWKKIPEKIGKFFFL
jgi:hypothetical protein